jgi:hypothetical protein
MNTSLPEVPQTPPSLSAVGLDISDHDEPS